MQKAAARTILVTLLLAGCAGPAAEDAAISSSTSAAAPLVSHHTGSIQGFVYDDEQVPLPGAQVLHKESDTTTVADPSGAYTINGLNPGTHHVFVQRTGYAQVASKAEVVAGQVTWLNFSLEPFSLIVPYVEVIPKTAFIDFGQFQLDILLLKGLNQTCKSCKFPLLLENAPQSFLGEYVFKMSTPTAPGYDKIGYHLYRNYTGDNPYQHQAQCIASGCSTFIGAGYLADREGYSISGAAIKKPTDQLTWYVTSSQFPNYQQKLDIWFSIAHHDDFPDGYTATPPK